MSMERLTKMDVNDTRTYTSKMTRPKRVRGRALKWYKDYEVIDGDASGNQLPPIVTKKRRGNLPKESRALLKQWLSDHRYHAYPTDVQKSELAAKANMTTCQVSNWYINARRRVLPDMIKRDGFDPLHFTISRKHKPRRSAIKTVPDNLSHVKIWEPHGYDSSSGLASPIQDSSGQSSPTGSTDYSETDENRCVHKYSVSPNSCQNDGRMDFIPAADLNIAYETVHPAIEEEGEVSDADILYAQDISLEDLLATFGDLRDINDFEMLTRVASCQLLMLERQRSQLRKLKRQRKNQCY